MSSEQDVGGAVEALGEQLFALSAQLKASGFLDSDPRRAVYERVVAAFQELDSAALAPSDAAKGEDREFVPRIGDQKLGSRLSDGDRLCASGHNVAEGEALYWPANPISQYDDSDPYCFKCAIDRAERMGYPLPATPAPVDAGGVERDRIAAAIADMQIDHFREWAANGTTYPNSYQSAIDLTFERADRVIAVIASHAAPLAAGLTQMLPPVAGLDGPYLDGWIEGQQYLIDNHSPTPSPEQIADSAEGVIQADRDRAAEELRASSVGGYNGMADLIELGDADDDRLVRAFAAHRLAYTPRQADSGAETVERLAAFVAFAVRCSAGNPAGIGLARNQAVELLERFGIEPRPQGVFFHDISADERDAAVALASTKTEAGR